MSIRVYLTGRMAVETPSEIADEAKFPGRQGRLAFAYLALSAQRPVAHDALADAIWMGEPPPSWESALKSLISKLRSMLHGIGVAGESVTSLSGCYQLRLPVDTWIDLEACARAVDVGEAAIARGDIDAAWSEATVATAIARRPFLPGEDAMWLDDIRIRLRSSHVRALDTLAGVWLVRNNAAQAVSIAAEAVGLEPYRETGYRLLMRAHALAGNRAEAARTYDRCARVLSDELGVEPDPETTALRDSLQTRTRHSDQQQTLIIAVTDIVESTKLAAALGDRRWHELLSEHDAITRNCVNAMHGQVVKHLGDGFLLTFASTGAAIESLAAIIHQAASLDESDQPLTVRVGIHAGEPITHDDDLFGLQVNIAARINAIAEAGEILASAVIRDLSPPGRVRFSASRTVNLKGIPDPITIYRAELADNQH